MSQQINLYNPVFRKQEKLFSAAAMAKGLALIAVAVAAFFFYVSMQSSVLEIRAAQSGQQLKGELERLKAYGVRESPAERAKALAERRKALEEKLAAQTQALAVFESSVLGRAEGYSELLRAFARLSMDGVWLTRIQFADGGGALSISGRATHAELVPAYLERLRSEDALRGQEFSRLEVKRSAAAGAAPGASAAVAGVEFVLSSGEAEGAK